MHPHWLFNSCVRGSRVFISIDYSFRYSADRAYMDADRWLEILERNKLQESNDSVCLGNSIHIISGMACMV